MATSVLQEVDPRFPIGKFQTPDEISVEQRSLAIAVIEALPAKLKDAVHGLSDAQLDTPYRDGGWTVRQLVHHIADSHMNAFCRVRLGLTEDWPTIFAYNEKAWAMLDDSAKAPIALSLGLLEGLHARWAMMLRSLVDAQWARGVKHPQNGPMSVELSTQLYAWHCRHHVAHITRLRESRGW
jgi:hypothetical protein